MFVQNNELCISKTSEETKGTRPVIIPFPDVTGEAFLCY